MRKVLGWFIVLITPLAILLTAVRLLLTPAFVWLEYHTPAFPADSFGMTQQQRLEYAPLALDYLLNDQGISFLADQRFPDGKPLYNERELSHMDDVKALAQTFLRVWLLSVALLIGVAAIAWRFGWWAEFRGWLGSGGRLTVFLILALLVLVVFSFDALFVGFHRIFFEGDTWLFLFSDTLIRLFPIRFWRDVFLTLATLTLLGGAALWRFVPPKAEKPKKQKQK